MKYRDEAMGGTNFPVLFEQGNLMVYKNSSDEIFVQNGDTTIRITPFYKSGFKITAGNGKGRLEPTSVNGLPAFQVLSQK